MKVEGQIKEAKLYKKEGKDVRCLACNHKCLIPKGATGICGVRRNEEGNLHLLVYGRVAAVHVDPIEKKPLYHFLPGTLTFSIGTIGCNFKCGFCQNHDISQFKDFYGDKIIGERIGPKQIVQKALRAGCKSIAYTYNEPAIFAEFIRDIAKLAKKKDLKNVMVSNGYFSTDCFNFLKKYIDAINIDLKSFSEEFYTKLCGASLKPVLDTIKRAHKAGIHVEITTLVIPEENDTDEELEKIAKFIASVSKDIPWHISRFFPNHKVMNRPITPMSTLERAYEIGKKHLKYVHIGNV